jgi:AcrR family transcriptional regulator
MPRTTRRPGLDRAKIVEAAVEIIDAEGSDALTLNRLASAVGVKVPSLYNHMDGLPGLQRELSLLSTRRLRERVTQVVVGKSGPAALRALAHSYRGFAKESPGLYLAGVRSSVGTADAELEDEQARLVGLVLAVVSSFGLEGDAAVHAVRGLRSLVHGFVTLEIAGGFGMPLDCDQSFAMLVDIFISGLEARGAV